MNPSQSLWDTISKDQKTCTMHNEDLKLSINPSTLPSQYGRANHLETEPDENPQEDNPEDDTQSEISEDLVDLEDRVVIHIRSFVNATRTNDEARVLQEIQAPRLVTATATECKPGNFLADGGGQHFSHLNKI